MEGKMAVSLSPAIEAKIAEVEGMTVGEIRRLLLDCMTGLPEGRINANEGEALTRAVDKRIGAIRKEQLATARLMSELARRQTQRIRWIMEDPMICDTYEASLAPA